MIQPSVVVDGAGSVFSGDDTPTRLAVTTLLVVQQARGAWLERTLAALAAQQRAPERLVVIDASAERSMADLIGAHEQIQDAFPDVSVVSVPPHTPFAAVIDSAVEALPGPGEDIVVARRPRRRAKAHKIRPRDRHEWLWLLHEDSAPAPDALAQLVRVVGQSSRIGVAGCKIVAWDDPGRLVNVGIDLTRTGRHVGAEIEGEPDQGQHDARRDVLAVSSAGMLVRRDVYTRLGGFDPAFDGDGDGLDLCWRAHLSSHQVVVVPDAKVHQDLATRYDAPDRPAPRSARTLRRHRQVALARCSLLGLPVMALWTAVSCTLLALIFLLLKRGRRAGIELAQASAPLGLGRIIGARWRFFRRASARRRSLRALFVPPSGAAHAAIESLHDSVALDGSETSDEGPAGRPDDGRTQPDRGGARNLLTNPGFWAVLVLIAASVVLWRDLITTDAFRGGGHGLAGGQLQPFSTDGTGIWRMWRDGWQGPGLGHPALAVPYLPVLAGLTWLVQWIPGVTDASAGATTIAYLLAACMPLSGWTAYRASRIITGARWPRAAAAVAWATLATLTTAVSGGRLGPAVAHVVLPLAVAGVFAIARRRAGSPATFGTALAAAVLGAFAPPLLALVTVMALVVTVTKRGWARLRGLVVAVLPWMLLAPWTREVLRGDWRVLLGGPGGLDIAQGSGAQAWQLALLHPGGPGSYAVLASVPVLLCGALGLLRSGRPAAQVGLVLLALVGLAGGLAASHVMLVHTADGAMIPWSGLALDVFGLALLALALLSVRSPARRGGGDTAAGGEAGADERSRAHRLLGVARPTAVVAAVVVSIAVAGLAVWTAPVRALQPAPRAFNGIVDAPVHGTRAVRVLDLSVSPSGSISYALRGQETGLPVRGFPTPPTAEPSTADAVAELLTPGGRGTGPTVAQRLHRLAVYAVVVHGSADASLTRSLQATGILTPLHAGADMTVWRVAPMQVRGGRGSVDASRVSLYSAGTPLRELPSTMAHARSSTDVPSGPADRTVVLSEGLGWRDLGTARLDGRELAATTVDGRPAYRLGASGGHLVIDPGVAFERLRLLQLGLLIVVTFLAVPLGNRRSRRSA